MTTIYVLVEWTDQDEDNHCHVIKSFRTWENAYQSFRKAVEELVQEEHGDTYDPKLLSWSDDYACCNIDDGEYILEIQQVLLE